MTIIIFAKYDKDPRQRRCVVKDGVAAPTEVATEDHLGDPSWRPDKDPPVYVQPDAMVARALDVMSVCAFGPASANNVKMNNVRMNGDRLTIDLGTVYPDRGYK